MAACKTVKSWLQRTQEDSGAAIPFISRLCGAAGVCRLPALRHFGNEVRIAG
jgi:hypothetical protein